MKIANVKSSPSTAEPNHNLEQLATMLRSGDTSGALSLTEAALAAVNIQTPNLPEATEAIPKMTQTPTDHFHALVINFYEANAAFNAGENPWEDSKISDALGLAIQAIETTNVSATTYESAIHALRLANEEFANFNSTQLSGPLVKGALSYFEACDAEHPWKMARRLSRQLAATLEKCDGGDWYANIMPPGEAFRTGFGSSETGAPVDRVNRLAWELSDALNDFQNGRFQARIYPSDQAGHAVMFVSTKAAPEERRSMLSDLITEYREAQRIWRETPDDADEKQSPEWDAYERAEAAVLHFPCSSIDEIRMKAAFVLADDNAFDTIQNCVDRVGGDEVPSLRPFLLSLLGEA